jgi:FKBP-type peptidyl-prolyl cis-trans isomerase
MTAHDRASSTNQLDNYTKTTHTITKAQTGRKQIKFIMGVTKEVLKAGNGSKPNAGQKVTVHCTGYGKNRDLTKKFWCE